MDTPSTRPGWKTSEFWLSLLGIVGAIALPYTDQAVAGAGHQLQQHGTAGAIAAAAIAGAYAVGRSVVKAAQLNSAAPTPQVAPIVDPSASQAVGQQRGPGAAW